MSSLTIEDIDNLDPEDVGEALDLLLTLDISPDGVETVADARRLLIEHLRTKQGDDSTLGQVKVLICILLKILLFARHL